MRSGFTLIEVLVAFGILLSALVLIAAGLGRHLAALQGMERFVAARQLAESQMTRELLLRELPGLSIPPDLLPEGFSSEWSLKDFPLEVEPVKDLEMEQGTSVVTWRLRGQDRSLELVTVLRRRPQR